jgi:hypothetical protein
MVQFNNTRILISIGLTALFYASLSPPVLLSDPSKFNPSFIYEIDPDWRNVVREPLDFYEPTGIINPVLTADDVTDRVAEYVADPFLFRENDIWYMFLEVQEINGHGDIGLATSSDGLNWNYDRIVLDESFHVSYPFVFKSGKAYYMTLETYITNEVRLYKSSDFPYDWSYHATLISGRDFVDPSIFWYNGLWWMFVGETTNQYCYLYYSADLTDNWIEHPSSPVVYGDRSRARPAGRPIVFDGDRIIRYAQKCDVMYGEAVRAFEVTTLTTTNYSEFEAREDPILGKSGSGWNRDGMHNVDPWWIGDRWLAAVDGIDRTGGGVTWFIGIYETLTNNDPVIFSVPDTIAIATREYFYDVDAEDPEGDSLYFSLKVSPSWLSMDSITGIIAGVPPMDALGDTTVTVLAIDEFGGTGSQTYPLTVIPGISIHVRPVNTIVPLGEELCYSFSVANNTDEHVDFQFWTDMLLPVGSFLSPVISPSDLMLGSGEDFSMYVSHLIPGNAPLGGPDLYCVDVGVYPDSIFDSDCFEFEVVLPPRIK